MVNGAVAIGVRGSICASVFIVGAGAPGGVRLPCAKAATSELESATDVRMIFMPGFFSSCGQGTMFAQALCELVNVFPNGPGVMISPLVLPRV